MPVQEKQESTFTIVKRNLANPDRQTKAAMQTMKVYTSAVSVAVSLPSIVSGTASGIDALCFTSDVSQLVTSGEGFSTGNQNTDKAIQLVQTGLDFMSLYKATNAIVQLGGIPEKSASLVPPGFITDAAGAAEDMTEIIPYINH